MEIVDTRIKEANLVLGERSAFLKELEKEREIALQYTESKTKLTNAKATLLKTEMDSLEKDFEEVLEHNKKLNQAIEAYNRASQNPDSESEIRDYAERRLKALQG